MYLLFEKVFTPILLPVDSQLMEQERINTFTDSLRQYIGMLDMTATKLQTVCQEISEVVARISPQSDIESTCNRAGMEEYIPEQVLYYGYENLEDTGLKPETRRYVSSGPSDALL